MNTIHRLFTWFVVVLIFISVSTSNIQDLKINDVVSGTPTVQEQVQAVIDEINETITLCNSSMCYLKGNDGNHSKAVNYTEELIMDSLYFNSVFNGSLSNFTDYPTLLLMLFSNLSEICTEYKSLSPQIHSLKNDSIDLVDAMGTICDYIDTKYDRNSTSEENFSKMAAELNNDTYYNNSLIVYINDYYKTVGKYQNLTEKYFNITLNFSITAMQLMTYLYENVTGIHEESKKNSSSAEYNTTLNKSKKSTLDDFKLVTHNEMYDSTEGEDAYDKAEFMEISKIRKDFRWKKLDTPYHEDERWAWEESGNEDWTTLHDNLLFTKDYGMNTMAVLLTFECPYYLWGSIDQSWDDLWDSFELLDRQNPTTLDRFKAALFASYGYMNLADDYPSLASFSPENFIIQLLKELDKGIEDGDYDVGSFNVLNEPNTKRYYFWGNYGIGEHRWDMIEIPYDVFIEEITLRIIIPYWFNGLEFFDFSITLEMRHGLFEPYTTADMTKDLLYLVKLLCCWNYPDTLGDAKTIVNLYSMSDGWRKPAWTSVARSQYLDVLGFDFYPDQWWSQWGKKYLQKMEDFAKRNDIDKPWWIIETPGAWGPKMKEPLAKGIQSLSEEMMDTYDADVVGWYKLWGEKPSGSTDYAGAYDIFIKYEGSNPQAAVDKDGYVYYVYIQRVT